MAFELQDYPVHHAERIRPNGYQIIHHAGGGYANFDAFSELGICMGGGAPGATGVRQYRMICWLLGLVALAVPRVACAQPATVLDLEVRIAEITGAVLGLSVPVEAATAAGEGVGTRETASEIRITLPADILFDFDKADIRPSAASALHQTADLIRTRATGLVKVEGHTDAKDLLPIISAFRSSEPMRCDSGSSKTRISGLSPS